jgi:hypothetical protein
MPFYYDLNTGLTSSGSAGNSTNALYGYTVGGGIQETVGIVGVYAASRFGSAGGAQIRVQTGTNTTNSSGGGNTATATPRNFRNTASVSQWLYGPTLFNSTQTPRLTVGFAQTGGMGGWIPLTPQDAIQLMPQRQSPSDINFYNLASATSVTFDQTIELTEGY